MNWIRNNPSLAAGIFLPLLLMGIFAVATTLPKILVDPPKHDLLFYLDRYSEHLNADIRLNVVDGKLKAEYRNRKEPYRNTNVALYYYSAATDSVRQISVVPPASPLDEWQELPIAETSSVILDTSETSPDGYRVNDAKYRGGHVFGLFGPSSYSRGFGISKNGRMVMIKSSPDVYYGNAHFLGWVVSK